MSELTNARVVVVVFAMKGCGACEEYAPRFERYVDHFRTNGVPFVWNTMKPAPGQIPVLLLDAASPDESIQAFADKLKISATPTTCVMTKFNTTKVEGALPNDEIHRILDHAMTMNR